MVPLDLYLFDKCLVDCRNQYIPLYFLLLKNLELTAIQKGLWLLPFPYCKLERQDYLKYKLNKFKKYQELAK